ncbi:unnamed protein product [Sphagnum balticum]
MPKKTENEIESMSNDELIAFLGLWRRKRSSQKTGSTVRGVAHAWCRNNIHQQDRRTHRLMQVMGVAAPQEVGDLILGDDAKFSRIQAWIHVKNYLGAHPKLMKQAEINAKYGIK